MKHIYPLNDIKEHDTSEYGSTRDCNPKIIVDNEILVIHNSFDGREGLELANEILNK